MTTNAIGNAWNADTYDDKHGFVWRFGSDVVELLAPQSGERILDLGSGTGRLAASIAESGALVTGIDGSDVMVAKARSDYPGLSFACVDARTLAENVEFADASFDAVFSNATLHWILQPEPVIAGVARLLRPSGRFVAEMGGVGNIAAVRGAIAAALADLGFAMPPAKLFFPTPAHYAGLLERHGFEIRALWLFDRPTPLEGEHGLAAWVEQFATNELHVVPLERRAAFLELVERHGRADLHDGTRWVADYRRLRFTAIRAAATSATNR